MATMTTLVQLSHGWNNNTFTITAWPRLQIVHCRSIELVGSNIFQSKDEKDEGETKNKSGLKVRMATTTYEWPLYVQSKWLKHLNYIEEELINAQQVTLGALN